jgi:hypothetical protein
MAEETPMHVPDTPSIRLRRWLAAAALALCAGGAHATLITFSEIPWSPNGEDGAFYDQPIAPDFYAAQGVRIEGGYLAGGQYDPGAQYLLGGNSMQVFFTGVLPTYVSLVFNSPFEEAGAWVDANGPGYSARVDTGGYLGGLPGDEPYPPPKRDVHASFSSPGGISSLLFDNAYFFRVSAYVDNLYFGNVPAVPEPGSMVLMGAGLAGMWMWRRRHGAKAASQG